MPWRIQDAIAEARVLVHDATFERLLTRIPPQILGDGPESNITFDAETPLRIRQAFRAPLPIVHAALSSYQEDAICRGIWELHWWKLANDDWDKRRLYAQRRNRQISMSGACTVVQGYDAELWRQLQPVHEELCEVRV